MKTVPNFPDYSITKDGRIKSYHSDKWLSPGKTKSGHLLVSLYKNRRRYYKFMHRLVLETYVGKCPDNMECRHLDGNPQNNNLSNLKWDTHKANSKDTAKHGTQYIPNNKGERNVNTKLKEKDVRMIVYMYRTGLFQQKEIAEVYKISKHTVVSIVNKRNWKYLWN